MDHPKIPHSEADYHDLKDVNLKVADKITKQYKQPQNVLRQEEGKKIIEEATYKHKAQPNHSVSTCWNKNEKKVVPKVMMN